MHAREFSKIYAKENQTQGNKISTPAFFLLRFVRVLTIVIEGSNRRDDDAVLDAVLGDRTTNCPFHHNHHILYRQRQEKGGIDGSYFDRFPGLFGSAVDQGFADLQI